MTPRIDEEGDSICPLCGRIAIKSVPAKTVPHNPQIIFSNGRQPVRPSRNMETYKRYRSSVLYKKTRKKHDKKWRSSEKGKQAARDYYERIQALRRIADRLWRAEQKGIL